MIAAVRSTRLHFWQCTGFLLLIAVIPSPGSAQQQPLTSGCWTRGLAGGCGHSWQHGVPGYGKTESDVSFVAFHPQLGRFVTDHLELYGDGTLLLHYEPTIEVGGGLAGLGGRYHVWSDREWTPYIVAAAGLI